VDTPAQPQLSFDTDPLPPKAVSVLGHATTVGGDAERRVRGVDHAPMLLTVRDVEAELQLGRTRTYELIRSGELPVIRLGRAVRVPREALAHWMPSTKMVADRAVTGYACAMAHLTARTSRHRPNCTQRFPISAQRCSVARSLSRPSPPGI